MNELIIPFYKFYAITIKQQLVHNFIHFYEFIPIFFIQCSFFFFLSNTNYKECCLRSTRGFNAAAIHRIILVLNWCLACLGYWHAAICVTNQTFYPWQNTRAIMRGWPNRDWPYDQRWIWWLLWWTFVTIQAESKWNLFIFGSNFFSQFGSWEKKLN